MQSSAHQSILNRLLWIKSKTWGSNMSLFLSNSLTHEKKEELKQRLEKGK